MAEPQDWASFPDKAQFDGDETLLVRNADGTPAEVPTAAISLMIGTNEIWDDTEANLQADLAHAENKIMLVIGDPDPAKNGYYRKLGASGAGSWDQFQKLSSKAVAEVQAAIDAANLALDAKVADAQAAAQQAVGASIAAEQYRWVAVIDDATGTGNQIVPAAQYDVHEGRAFVNGELRTLTDVATQDGPLRWTITEGPDGMTSAGWTVVTDFRYPEYFTEANQPLINSTLFSMDGGAGNIARLEYMVRLSNSSGTAVPPGGAGSSRYYHSSLDGGFNSDNYRWLLGPVLINQIKRHQGTHRSIYSASMVGGENPLMGQDAMGVHAASTANGFLNQQVPSRYAIGQIRFDNSAQLANAEVDQVIIYNEPLNQAQCENVQEFNEYGFTPRLFYGDSGNNLHQVEEAVSIWERRAGLRYIPRASFSFGGNGLKFHRDLLAYFLSQHPRYSKFLFLMFEMGMDYTNVPEFDATQGGRTPASKAFQHLTNTATYTDYDVLTYYRDIFDMFPRSPLLISPNIHVAGYLNTQGGSGPATYARLSGLIQKIRETFPIEFVETLRPLQLGAADSAAFEQHLIDDTIPTDLIVSGSPTDVHIQWSDPLVAQNLAYEMLGNEVRKALAERGESW